VSGERSEPVTPRVGAPVPAPGLGFRFFAAPRGQPRARRGTDLVLLVPAVLVIALAIAAYPPSSLEQSLEAFLVALPDWLDPVWGFLSDLLWLWALALIAIALARVRLVVVGQAVPHWSSPRCFRSGRAALPSARGPTLQTRSSERPTQNAFPRRGRPRRRP
jgi:hypothetical protein